MAFEVAVLIIVMEFDILFLEAKLSMEPVGWKSSSVLITSTLWLVIEPLLSESCRLRYKLNCMKKEPEKSLEFMSSGRPQKGFDWAFFIVHE